MAQVIPCPQCGRPNGPKFTQCMYCGADLPERGEEEAVAQGPGESSEPLATTMDPKLLASLPPKLRAQLHASAEPGSAAPPESDATSQAAAPPVTPPRLPDEPGGTPTKDPTDLVDRDSLDEMITGEYESLEKTVTGEYAEVDALLSGEHPVVTSAGSGEYAAVDEDDVQTDQYRQVTDAGPDSPLLHGRGAFGARGATARVLLLPDPAYRQNLPWLRARLDNLLGIDAYTANLYLQREFPVFLKEFDEMAPAWALEDDLIAGGLRVLVLTRDMVEGHREAYPAERAEIDDETLLFESADRPPLQLERRDLELAILGEVKPLETPGGPLVERTFWRVKSRPSRSFSDIQHPYWLLHLVSAEPTVPVRIRQDRFDFGCLGPARKPSTLLNLKTLPARFAVPGKGVVVDELFRRVPRVRREAIASEDGSPADGPPEEEVLFSEYALIQTLARRAGRGGSIAED